MALIDDTFALISVRSRSIGYIIPNVVLSELGRDDMVVTDHPVEIGAPISDHAFLLPTTVEMRCGWSNSTAGYVGYVQSVYQELLALQAMREPFSVSTGKRRYKNMLIVSLMQHTDQYSEHALMVTVRMREVILTSTSQGAAPAASQQAPASTQPTQNLGTQQLKPASTGRAAGSV